MKKSYAIAKQLLTMISIDAGNPELKPLELAENQHNFYRQRPCSNDCGLAVWQVLQGAFCRQRGECPTGVLPRPVEWRKQLLSLLNGLVKEENSWTLELAQSKKPKYPVIVPGAKPEDMKKNKALFVYKNAYFTCSSCRWSESGAGCVYCNPKKMEVLLEEKERRAVELSIAVKKALAFCVHLGVLEPIVEDAATEPQPLADVLQGGGLHNKM